MVVVVCGSILLWFTSVFMSFGKRGSHSRETVFIGYNKWGGCAKQISGSGLHCLLIEELLKGHHLFIVMPF